MAVIHGCEKVVVPQYVKDLTPAPVVEVVEEIIGQEFDYAERNLCKKYCSALDSGDFAKGDSILDEDDEARNKELQDGKVIAEKIRVRRETLRKIAFPELLDIYNKNVADAAESAALVASSRNALKIAKEKAFFARHAPDYKHWAMQPIWSIDEAVALILDIEPRAEFYGGYSSQIDLRKHLEKTKKESLIAQQYFDYYETLCNIVRNSNFRSEERKPSFYIQWAKSNDIEVLEKLTDALKKYGHNDADWHTQSIEQAATIQRLEKKIAVLEKAAAASSEKNDKDLTTQAKNSYRRALYMTLCGNFGTHPEKWVPLTSAREIISDYKKKYENEPLKEDRFSTIIQEAKTLFLEEHEADRSA